MGPNVLCLISSFLKKTCKSQFKWSVVLVLRDRIVLLRCFHTSRANFNIESRILQYRRVKRLAKHPSAISATLSSGYGRAVPRRHRGIGAFKLYAHGESVQSDLPRIINLKPAEGKKTTGTRFCASFPLLTKKLD